MTAVHAMIKPQKKHCLESVSVFLKQPDKCSWSWAEVRSYIGFQNHDWQTIGKSRHVRSQSCRQTYSADDFGMHESKRMVM